MLTDRQKQIRDMMNEQGKQRWEYDVKKDHEHAESPDADDTYVVKLREAMLKFGGTR